MTEQDKKIIETFVQILPNLTESDKQRLLWFGEGMAFKAESLKEGEKKVSWWNFQAFGDFTFDCMGNTARINEMYRLNEILDGASKLPLECQEHILAVIRGMIFTREITKKRIWEGEAKCKRMS